MVKAVKTPGKRSTLKKELTATSKKVVQNIQRFAMADFVEQSYLDYSMYVILDRALPSICDGLKPVQRRIVYAMSELGLNASAKPKKSARTIGDVIGKYHPHGEVACYEAMVLMSQNFAYRYPLIDGQGNWGSIDDPKSFAAMRYTEARMTAYASTLLDELGQGTTTWRKNFDGTLEEPEILPAQLPNIILNGASGIAIGMSTDIPPHNLTEVSTACMLLLDKANTQLDEILKIIKAPDFPSGGDIVSSAEEIRDIYVTGSGHLRIRAQYNIEKNKVVITNLPYQVSIVRIMKQIRSLTENSKFNLITDLIDESDDVHPVRLVIDYHHSKIKVDEFMAYLFSHTDLERTQRVHFNVIGLDLKPEVKPLLKLLHEWLAFRTRVVKKRLEVRIQAIERRVEILDGFKKVFANLDALIQVIRTADKPKESLMKKFNLTAVQAEAVLEIRLRRLAKLEQEKIDAEYRLLQKEKAENEKYLSSERRLKTLIKKEIKQNMLRHGDERRTRLSHQPLLQSTLDTTKFIVEEKFTAAISKMGWMRAIRGHELDTSKIQCRTGDEWLSFIESSNKESLLLLDSTGRAYTLSGNKIEISRSGQPLGQFLSIAEGAHFAGAIEIDAGQEVLMGSNAGYALRAPLDALLSNNRKGKQILTVQSSEAEAVQLMIYEQKFLKEYIAVAVNRAGYVLTVPLNELPILDKGKGRKLMQIDRKKFVSREEEMFGLVCLRPGDILSLHSGQRHKRFDYATLSEHVGKCAQRGLKLSKFKTLDKLQLTTKALLF